jgi:hypothetical protein
MSSRYLTLLRTPGSTAASLVAERRRRAEPALDRLSLDDTDVQRPRGLRHGARTTRDVRPHPLAAVDGSLRHAPAPEGWNEGTDQGYD